MSEQSVDFFAMLRRAEAAIAAHEAPQSAIDEVSHRDFLSEDDGEIDLDALDFLDEFHASDAFGGFDASWRGLLPAVGPSQEACAEYNEHLSSSFVKKSGALARNYACVDLAQLNTLACHT
eukprot:3245137-Rhodomonas_salina.1